MQEPLASSVIFPDVWKFTIAVALSKLVPMSLRIPPFQTVMMEGTILLTEKRVLSCPRPADKTEQDAWSSLGVPEPLGGVGRQALQLDHRG